MANCERGRIRVSLRPINDEPGPRHRDEIPRIVRLLALAHRWHRLIDEGTVESQAEIARMTGLSRARITQIMDLRWLPPEIQAEVLTGGLRKAFPVPGSSWQSASWSSPSAEGTTVY